MAINKLTNEEINKVKVEGRGNPLTGGVAANQAVFDALPKKVNEKLNQVIDEVNAAGASASAHFSNKNNPHSVTKVQVGLGNVDNTADLNKPVSNAVAAELGKKADKATVDAVLEKKADKTAVDTALNLKADKTELEGKADKEDVAESLGLKADKAELDKKADLRTSGGGFEGGDGAVSGTTGAAIGADAHAFYGGLAGGVKSRTDSGLAGGSQAYSFNGFAGGKGAVTGAGVAAGEEAQTVDANGKPIDAIQLGTGVNKKSKTLQVYDHPVFDANTGKLLDNVIPETVTEAIRELEAEVESKGESTYPKFVAERWDTILAYASIRFESADLPLTLPKGTRLQYTEGEEECDVVLIKNADGERWPNGKVRYSITSNETGEGGGSMVSSDTVIVTLPDYWEYGYSKEQVDAKVANVTIPVDSILPDTTNITEESELVYHPGFIDNTLYHPTWGEYFGNGETAITFGSIKYDVLPKGAILSFSTPDGRKEYTLLDNIPYVPGMPNELTLGYYRINLNTHLDPSPIAEGATLVDDFVYINYKGGVSWKPRVNAGDIESALDEIIEIQEALIGGDEV